MFHGRLELLTIANDIDPQCLYGLMFFDPAHELRYASLESCLNHNRNPYTRSEHHSCIPAWSSFDHLMPYNRHHDAKSGVAADLKKKVLRKLYDAGSFFNPKTYVKSPSSEDRMRAASKM